MSVLMRPVGSPHENAVAPETRTAVLKASRWGGPEKSGESTSAVFNRNVSYTHMLLWRNRYSLDCVKRFTIKVKKLKIQPESTPNCSWWLPQVGT